MSGRHQDSGKIPRFANNARVRASRPRNPTIRSAVLVQFLRRQVGFVQRLREAGAAFGWHSSQMHWHILCITARWLPRS